MWTALGSCRKAPDPIVSAPGAAPAPAVKGPTARPSKLFVRSRRCGECHERMLSEWQGSAHARATHSTAFRRAMALLPEADQGLCWSCHLPGKGFGQAGDEPDRPSDGVSCDACHTLSAVRVEDKAAIMTFTPGTGRKYGPIPGASGHYFHDMAYSELHTRSEHCAGCHHLLGFSLGGQAHDVPVVTDYAGWRRHGRERPCQECHMPARGTAPVARGSRPRPAVPAHTFLGPLALARQLRLEVSEDREAGVLVAEMAHSAGHLVPAGFADRRLLLRVSFYGAGGTLLHTEDRAYGIFLLDGAGRPAPFFQATQLKEDRRMAPGRTYTESFRIPEGPDSKGRRPLRAVVSLLAAATAPELAAVYGEPELTMLKSAVRSLHGGLP